MSTPAAPKTTPPSDSSGDNSAPSKKRMDTGLTTNQRSQFLVLAAYMTWQLAIVVLVPVIGGVELDKAFGTHLVWTFIGLGLALIGTIIVMWKAVQTANHLPVPKLTEAQKRAIKKQYDEEDEDK